MPEEVLLHCEDGVVLTAKFFPAENSSSILIIAGGLGILQHFYINYADFFSSNGVSVLTFDYRCTGDSDAVMPKQDVKLEDWGIQDISAAINFAYKKLNDNFSQKQKLFFVGHSIGGQLVGMANNVNVLDGIVLVAASSPHWSRWSFPKNISMFLNAYVLLPFLSIGRKEFPARRIGFSSKNLPAVVILRWAHWMRVKNYFFNAKFKLDTSRFASIKADILSLTISDDDMAPERNVKALLRHFPSSKLEHRVVDVESLNMGSVGHVGYFREKAQHSLWQETLNWFKALS